MFLEINMIYFTCRNNIMRLFSGSFEVYPPPDLVEIFQIWPRKIFFRYVVKVIIRLLLDIFVV